MREIKFRAWDRNKNVMMAVKSINYADDGFAGTVIIQSVNGDTYVNGESCDLIQYTGRMDKDGVEVYDGDVITAYFDAINGQYLITYTVKFDEFHSLYPFEDFGRYEGPMHFTVIGNRYENPELSKEV